MRKAGVAELKASLSEYLAAIKAGEEVIITERGRPIARITPIASHHSGSHRIEELVRAGILRRPQKERGKHIQPRTKLRDPRGVVLEALLADRQEGR